MKAITIKTFDKLLNKKAIEIIIVDENKVNSTLEWKMITLKRDIKEGFIDKKYQIEVHDKVRLTTMIL